MDKIKYTQDGMWVEAQLWAALDGRAIPIKDLEAIAEWVSLALAKDLWDLEAIAEWVALALAKD